MTKQSGCEGHTPRSTTTCVHTVVSLRDLSWSCWPTTSSVASWSSTPEPHRCLVATVTPMLFCKRNWMKQKRKKGKIIWGCLAAPVEFGKDICMSVGIQSDSCNQRRFGKSGRGQQLRLPECPPVSACFPVTLCFLKCQHSRLYFRATPVSKVYLAWKLRARTRKWFALTEIT